MKIFKTLGVLCLLIIFVSCQASCSGSGTTSGDSGGGDTSGGGGGGGGTSGACTTIADVTPPQKGNCVLDPEFNSEITRLTDKSIDGYSGTGIQNEYARTSPLNSDGTYLVLRSNDGYWYLYDAATFKMIKQLADVVPEGEEPEPRWDQTNPKVFYYFKGTKLLSYNVDTDASATIRDFTADFPTAAYVTTKTEGDASLDRNYFCLMVEDASYNLISVIIYDRSGNSITGQKNSGFPDSINWVSMDMTGNYCVIGYEDSDTDGDDQTPPVEVFNRTMTKVSTLPAGSTGHMDLALKADGTSVMVYQNNKTDWIAMADLATGAETNLVEIPFSVNPDIGLHISGNNAQRPGWALVSTYGSFNPPSGSSHSWMDNLLFMVELKSSPTIHKVAHTYAYTSLNFDGDKNYFAEAFAATNEAGTKIYWGSNWRIYETEYSDAYQVLIPAY